MNEISLFLFDDNRNHHEHRYQHNRSDKIWCVINGRLDIGDGDG